MAKGSVKAVMDRRLQRRLVWVLGLFILLGVNALYLGGISLLEWGWDLPLQNVFFQLMFLAHLVLGLVAIPALFVFALPHLRKAHRHPNRTAVRAGLFLLASASLVLLSGLLLIRAGGGFELQGRARTLVYLAHVAAPLITICAFILHRLKGPRLNWHQAGRVTVFAALTLLLAGGLHLVSEGVAETNPDMATPYLPSLARFDADNQVDPERLMDDRFCAECHQASHERWRHSVHKLSSFNNPVYRFAIEQTMAQLEARDGHRKSARFCAGCHDPVALLSGTFDDENFAERHPEIASAGITCTLCHGITSVESTRGNGNYTFALPTEYPFQRSDNAVGRWINRLLIQSNPAMHQRSLLKPVHQSAEFCSSCHKVHIPESLNHYRWLRGQNHYDSFLLSGISGHAVGSFYYPDRAQENCNGCHMPPLEGEDISARDGQVMDHLFPSANTALPTLTGAPEWVNQAHLAFNDNTARVDIVALHTEGQVQLLRPRVPQLVPGSEATLDLVVRNLGTGHALTQGTSDSNELWVELSLWQGDTLLAQSGALDPATGAVDPRAHFINSYLLDRSGHRIDRRQVADIFTPLYNHQIGPGSSDVLRYSFQVPDNAGPSLRVRARLLYRKFTTSVMAAVEGDNFRANELPVMALAQDQVVFSTRETRTNASPPNIPAAQRWKDYGIGLMRKPKNRFAREALYAFDQQAALGDPDGTLNHARVLFNTGRLEPAIAVLDTLRKKYENPPLPWVITWLEGQILREMGELDGAIERLELLAQNAFPDARARGYNFSKDYRMLNLLAQTYLERAEFGQSADDRRQAVRYFEATLALDSENLTAHFNLAQLYAQLGIEGKAARHAEAHRRYKPDVSTASQVVSAHRANNPAAANATAGLGRYQLYPVGSQRLVDALPLKVVL